MPKNDLEKRLKTAVADAAKLIELEAGKEYMIRAAGRMEKIPYRDIFYIERDGGKNSVIYSIVGTSKVRKSLQQVFEELAAPEFIFIDRGCIVNIMQIMKVADGMAFLKNGESCRSAAPIYRRSNSRSTGFGGHTYDGPVSDHFISFYKWTAVILWHLSGYGSAKVIR